MLTIYKASAGSGKTFTLAREFILLLLGIKDLDAAADQGDIVPGTAPRPYRLNLMPGDRPRLIENNRHRSILAITFTRKATEEMKTRIIGELRKLSRNPDDSDYVKDLTRDLHCSRADLAICSRLALKQLLFDYQNFNVSTIDAFFQRVLHTFARELDIQSNYTVELNDQDAMQEAVGSMLDQFNISAPGTTPLEGWLYAFMTEKIEEGRAGNFLNRRSGVHRSLVKQLAAIGKESFKPFFEKTKAYLSLKNNDQPLDKLRKTVAAELAALPNKISAVAKRLFGPDGVPLELISLKSVKENMQALIDGREVAVSDLVSTSYFKDLAEGTSTKGPFKSGKGTPEQAIAVQQGFAEILRLSSRKEYLRTLREGLTQLSLLSYAWPHLEIFVKDNNTLLLSDTNHLLQQIIGECDTPFVYERMGMRLKHFLIDEFQDTSQMQWTNLRPLVKNEIEEQDSLVIGDEKQSIYRFRNSDSSILHSQVQADFNGNFVSTGHEPDKNTNYRSSADVIRFNNTLFTIIAEGLGVDGYENVVQSIKKENLSYRGMVRCSQMPKTEEETFAQMAQQILRQIKDGGYRQSDIAILVNKNKEGRRIVEYLLSNYQGILNVASDEALTLASSSAVQMVISVMKSIDQDAAEAPELPLGKSPYPARQEILQKINRYQYFIGREAGKGVDPQEQAQATTNAMLHALSDTSTPDLGVDGVLKLRPDNLPALVEAIIDIHFSPETRKRHGAYLCALLDAVCDYCSNNAASLHGFLDWWDENSPSLTIGADSNANAIKVMTIHKSKGLEFHCVHIPLCNWQFSLDKSPELWATVTDDFACSLFPGYDLEEVKSFMPPALFVSLSTVNKQADSPFYREYAKECSEAVTDALNKTYVAFTRAKSELCLWYKPIKSETSPNIGRFLNKAFASGIPSYFRQDAMIDLSEMDGEDGVRQLGFPTHLSFDEKAKREEKESLENNVETIPYLVYPVSGKSLLMGADPAGELERDIDDAPAPVPAAPKDDDNAEAMDMLQDGLAMHEIMAKVVRPADVDRAARLVCGRMRADANTAKAYADLAHAIVEMPDAEINRWFVDFDKVLTETPIYIRQKDATKRPDRIVVCPDGFIDIIDYKFTSNPSHLGLQAHKTQVGKYASLMREMGHKRVRAYLLYPRLGKIVPVES